MVINYYDLSLKDLHYLLMLSEHKHFGRAAQAALVSQPALTKQIKEIEETLGFQIFERTKRQVSITSQGQELIKQAQVVVDEAQKLIEVSRDADELLNGPFHLGLIATSGPYLIPVFLNKLLKKYPEIQPIFKEGYTDDLLQELKLGQLDAVVAAAPVEDRSLETQKLFFEPFELMVHHQDCLASRRFISTKDLDASKMILLEEGNCLSDQSWALCPTKHKASSLQYQATSIETLCFMVAAGLGYSIIPKLSKPKALGLNKLLKFIPFKDKSIGREMLITFRKNYPNIENINALRCLIASLLGTL